MACHSAPSAIGSPEDSIRLAAVDRHASRRAWSNKCIRHHPPLMPTRDPRADSVLTAAPSSCGSSCTSCRCRTGTGRCGRPSAPTLRIGSASSPRRRRSSASLAGRVLRLAGPAAPRSPPACVARAPAHSAACASSSPISSMRKTVSVDPVLDALPHRVELLHALALVHDLRVLLGVAATGRRRSAGGPSSAGGSSTRVELVQHQAPLHPLHLRPVLRRRRRSTGSAGPAPASCRSALRRVDLELERRLAPTRPVPSRPRPRPCGRAAERLLELGVDLLLVGAPGSARRLDLQQHLLQLGPRLGAERPPRSACSACVREARPRPGEQPLAVVPLAGRRRRRLLGHELRHRRPAPGTRRPSAGTPRAPSRCRNSSSSRAGLAGRSPRRSTFTPNFCRTQSAQRLGPVGPVEVPLARRTGRPSWIAFSASSSEVLGQVVAADLLQVACR